MSGIDVKAIEIGIQGGFYFVTIAIATVVIIFAFQGIIWVIKKAYELFTR